jgi:hypothetical protein
MPSLLKLTNRLEIGGKVYSPGPVFSIDNGNPSLRAFVENSERLGSDEAGRLARLHGLVAIDADGNRIPLTLTPGTTVSIADANGATVELPIPS